MFYSQVILSKKGPLGKVWQAAHWGDKKLSRPAIFATNLEETVDAIVDPAAPLALRVSSHLLWGVVRIYSRKVEYLLDDCHQAVTKVNSVQKSTSTTSTTRRANIDLPARGSHTKNQLNVSHFGEFSATAVADDLGVMAGDFEIPFDLEKETTEEDWVPAELPDDAVPLQIPEPDVPEANNNKNRENDEDENWGNVEFNPFDDEDEEEEGGKKRDSNDNDSSDASALENPRKAAADLSETSLNNAPMDTSSIDISRANASNGVDNGEDNMMFDNGDDMMPFDDDSATQAVNLSDGKPTDDGGIDFGSPPVRGVSPSASEKSADPEITQKRRRTNDGKTKKKKKRKILIDDGEIILTTGEIKDMLNDTTSIAPPAVHPTEEESKHKLNSFLEDTPVEELFQRPTIGDDGFLAPGLVALWERNTAAVRGKPFQYELNTQPEEETESIKSLEDGEPGVPRDGDEMPPMDDTNDVSMPLSDEEMPPMMDDDEGPNIPFDDDQPTMDGRDSPVHSDESVFSLAAANDLDDMQLDEPLTSAKWHKNTVKVFEVLKHNLQQDDTEHVSFEVLSKNTSRRTAVGFFFEMLQLKTLDYIEIQQDESYGDIHISQGVRFAEDPPEAQQM